MRRRSMERLLVVFYFCFFFFFFFSFPSILFVFRVPFIKRTNHGPTAAAPRRPLMNNSKMPVHHSQMIRSAKKKTKERNLNFKKRPSISVCREGDGGVGFQKNASRNSLARRSSILGARRRKQSNVQLRSIKLATRPKSLLSRQTSPQGNGTQKKIQSKTKATR